ncbi:MAG TPA: ECF transporter S component [Clostridiaceae bacterium]|nr:ECF transporter S component [Clostridiaceae bacterium]
MENKTNSKKKLGLRQVVVAGMLSSISIVLGLTGYGFIALPTIKATILHIPVVIGAIVEGPVVGALIGLIFGLFSIFQNMINPGVLSFAFYNPMVSVLPRVLIGVVSYYTYKSIKVKSHALRIGIGAAAGTITNTVGVLSMIYIFYAARYAEIKGVPAISAAKLILGIAVVQGIPEIIVAVLVTIPAVLALNAMKKR